VCCWWLRRSSRRGCCSRAERAAHRHRVGDATRASCPLGKKSSGRTQRDDY
jgi:hypothetical protein